MGITISNAFITKLQMTQGNLNIFEDFQGTAGIVSSSYISSLVTQNLLVHLDAGNPDSYRGNVPSDGLLLHYDPSDTSSYSGTGTTVTDLSGNGDNGTLTNGVGFSSDLFTFDGTNDYIDVPDGFADFTNGMTIFVVANFGTADTWERIIDFGNGQGNNNIVLARNGISNDLTFEIYNGSTSQGKATLSNGVLNSTLASYAITIDGTNCRIYRNGSLQTTVSYTSLPNNVTRTNNYIGRSNWSADEYFQSQMGPVAIYDRTLSNNEISLMHDYYAITYSGITDPTTWTDLQGNYNGTLINGASYDSNDGGSLVTDGTNDYIRLDEVAGTGTSTQSMTYEVWVNPSDNNGNIMNMSSNTAQSGWNMPPIAAAGGKFRAKVWNNNLLYSSTFTQGNWYQVVLVWDYQNSSQTLYVNGTSVDSQSSISYGASGYNNYIGLGQANPGANNTGYFGGKYGIFRIYNKALTASEIQQNFNTNRVRYDI